MICSRRSLLIGSLLAAAGATKNTSVIATPGPGAASPAIRPGVATHLLVAEFPSSGGSEQGRLRPLDPLTLADAPRNAAREAASPAAAIPGTASGDFIYRELALSADGLTAVTITWPRRRPPHREVSVRRGVAGPEISRFSVPGELGGAIPLGQPGATLLSADGRRLVVAAEATTGTPPTLSRNAVAWSVYDTARGQLMATFRDQALGAPVALGGYVSLSALDPAGERLYRLVPASAAIPSGPQLTRLVATDVTTGAETGHLALPDVRAGEWNANGMPVPDLVRGDSFLWPALAVSPDGRQLAVVRGDGRAVVLVDTARLAVKRTVALSPPLARQRLTPLPTPPVAPAYPPQRGTRWSATYAADGTHLLTSGVVDDGAAGGQSTQPVALQRIDLMSGQVTARAPFPGWPGLWPTADGRGLYVPALADTNPTAPSLDLYRLDPVTLAPAARRTFSGRAYAVVWPRVPGSQLVTIWF